MSKILVKSQEFCREFVWFSLIFSPIPSLLVSIGYGTVDVNWNLSLPGGGRWHGCHAVLPCCNWYDVLIYIYIAPSPLYGMLFTQVHLLVMSLNYYHSLYELAFFCVTSGCQHILTSIICNNWVLLRQYLVKQAKSQRLAVSCAWTCRWRIRRNFLFKSRQGTWWEGLNRSLRGTPKTSSLFHTDNLSCVTELLDSPNTMQQQ